MNYWETVSAVVTGYYIARIGISLFDILLLLGTMRKEKP